MCPSVKLERTDEIPVDSRVCDYDELAEHTKQEFPAIAAGNDVTVDQSVATGFQGCDLVKYTDYYQVSVE